MLYRLDEWDNKIANLEGNMKLVGVYLNALAQLLIDNEICTPEDLVEMLMEKEEAKPNDK